MPPPAAVPRAALIIPVHNRKATTLRCLRHLDAEGDLSRFLVVVVDDGSTDGTGEAIQAEYPQVVCLRGDGHLWWTGAIAVGMRYAYEQGAQHLIWLNDDTLPLTGALTQLLAYCQTHPGAIAGGQCYHSPELASFTYGGRRRWRFRIDPVYAEGDATLPCDALDGNLVCLPRSVIDQIGYPPGEQVPHYGGDNLYTWLARKAGWQVVLLGTAKAVCPRDQPEVSRLLSDRTILAHWQDLRSPKSRYYVPGYWWFCWRFWGVAGWVPGLSPYLRLALITLLKMALPHRQRIKLKKWLGIPRSHLSHTQK